MIVTKLDSIGKDTVMLSSFGGLDRNVLISENCFSEMKNMTGDFYPMAAARSGRGRTGLSGISAMQICNTYGTKDDIGNSQIRENVFALVSEGEDGAVMSFKDLAGEDVLSPVTIGGYAKDTSLISRAGYVYAFPQGYRRACYSGGESGFLSLETVTTRAAAKDGQDLSGNAYFEMRPCDENGVADGGALATHVATKIYDGTAQLSRENEIIIVRADGLKVNEHGTTVKVDSTGKITEKYYGIAEEITVPDGGFALSGHGSPGTWLYNNATIGRYISIDGMKVSVFETQANSVVYEKPETPFNGLKWYDKATGNKYVFSSAQGEWTAYTTNYILFTYTEGGSAGDYDVLFDVTYNGEKKNDNEGNELRAPFEGFKEGDAIEIAGFSEERDGTYIIASLSNGGLVLNGIVDDTTRYQLDEVGKGVTISRNVPKMDFVIESGNRLWGCYYGPNDKGEVINEIYASALGDPTNWRRYQGISTDSWTATVGADGPFTGAIQYGGYPLFFKENAIIRVYGTQPSSFSTAEYSYRGVQKGSHKSLAICDEVLYYLSADGVMAYNGSVPQKVSQALGREHYRDGAGGSCNSKYYLSCRDSTDNVHLFVFDARYGFWHREDGLWVEQFLRHKTELYMLSGGEILTASGEGETVKFEAITGEWGLSDPFKKHFDRFIIRAIIPFSGELSVYISYDGGEWTPQGGYVSNGMTVFDIRNVPNRCDSVRLRFEGRGDVKIVSVYRSVSEGGRDVY